PDPGTQGAVILDPGSATHHAACAARCVAPGMTVVLVRIGACPGHPLGETRHLRAALASQRGPVMTKVHRSWGGRSAAAEFSVIASEVKQSRRRKAGLLRRCAPRNDGRRRDTPVK